MDWTLISTKDFGEEVWLYTDDEQMLSPADLDHATLEAMYQGFRERPSAAGGVVLDALQEIEQFISSVEIDQFVESAKPAVMNAVAAEALRRILSRWLRSAEVGDGYERSGETPGAEKLAEAVNNTCEAVQQLAPGSEITVNTYFQKDDDLVVSGQADTRYFIAKTTFEGEVLSLVFPPRANDERENQ